MRLSVRIGIVLSLGVVALTACNLPASGLAPSVWLDRPLDGESFPLAPLTMQAHAADAGGVARIEFLVFDSPIGGTDTGGTRLGETSLEWMPPQSGVYTLRARAVNNLGNIGVSHQVQITIGQIGSAVGGATSTPTPAPLGDVSTSSPTPAPVGGLPTGTASRTPTITLGPPILILTPPTLMVDTTPPEITNLLIDPSIISTKTICGATPATTTVSAMVIDAGGVQSVTVRILGFGTLEMVPVGGNVYQVTLGPFDEAAELQILIIASDVAGNTSGADPLTVQVIACPG
jgi:hypothetical protein